jgi:hypothetical protein
MTIINLTPHAVNVYPREAFAGLSQLNPTTWIAESVDETKEIKNFPSVGSCRISVEVVDSTPIEGIATVGTKYGNLHGIPETVEDTDTLIVSLPTKMMAQASGHHRSSQMVSPHEVVRLATDTSAVLGCMGFAR